VLRRRGSPVLCRVVEDEAVGDTGEIGIYFDVDRLVRLDGAVVPGENVVRSESAAFRGIGGALDNEVVLGNVIGLRADAPAILRQPAGSLWTVSMRRRM
jgi:hypothetical protein